MFILSREKVMMKIIMNWLIKSNKHIVSNWLRYVIWCMYLLLLSKLHIILINNVLHLHSVFCLVVPFDRFHLIARHSSKSIDNMSAEEWVDIVRGVFTGSPSILGPVSEVTNDVVSGYCWIFMKRELRNKIYNFLITLEYRKYHMRLKLFVKFIILWTG